MSPEVERIEKPAPRATSVLDTVAIVKARSGGRCEIQWTTNVCTVWGTEVHHRILGRHVGCDAPEMLLWACHSCHMTAHANTGAARARRIILSKFPGRNE